VVVAFALAGDFRQRINGDLYIPENRENKPVNSSRRGYFFAE
jgi:hypothetical protein